MKSKSWRNDKSNNFDEILLLKRSKLGEGGVITC